MDIIFSYLYETRSLIMVTHDEGLVSQYFSRVIMISEGTVLQDTNSDYKSR